MLYDIMNYKMRQIKNNYKEMQKNTAYFVHLIQLVEQNKVWYKNSNGLQRKRILKCFTTVQN